MFLWLLNFAVENKQLMKISKEDFERIGSEIQSDDSPVGIDAKKTHIMILLKLEEISKRLERLEKMAVPVSEG